MAAPLLALSEPMTQDKVPSRVRGQALVAVSFLSGLGCALFLSRNHMADVEPSISMAAQPLRLGSIQPRMLPGQASKMLASFPGDPTLKNKVARAIEATDGRCMARDVTARAEYKDMPAMPKEKVMEMPGITAPLGFWDPLGISTNVPEGRLLFYREAELKHGRVCMLAVLGIIVGDRHDFFPILGSGIPKDVPAYLFGTPYLTQTPIGNFWPLLSAALFFEELRRTKWAGVSEEQSFSLTMPTDTVPGDYGWDPLGLKPKNAKELKELQNKELNNGRLAMFAAAGMLAQEQATGLKVWPFSP